MARLDAPALQDMTPEQKRIHDEIVDGPRGGLRGPNGVWLHNAMVAGPAHKLGENLRFRGVLSPRQREMSILITGRTWKAQYEWYAHARIAREVGVDDAIIDAIHAGTRPAFADDADAAVHDLAKELHETRRVSDATYKRAIDILGVPAVVEVVGLCGYYTLVSMMLNTFEIDLPEGVEPPFKD